MYRAKIDVTLKKAVLDPQGKAVLSALHSIGFNEAQSVRVGKFIDVMLNVSQEDEAKRTVAALCDKLLVNAVIEEYSFSLEKVDKR
jgi:phosphoribosylformylglycinamidine synthase subunit PurS